MNRSLTAAWVLCLSCWSVTAAPAPGLVAHSQEQFQAIEASGRKTPLDALTPYGKRRLLASLRWGQDGKITGFSHASLVRELNRKQLAAALAFLDSSAYFTMLSTDLTGAALRLPEPSPDTAQRLERLEGFAQAARARNNDAPSTHLDGAPLVAHYMELFGDRISDAALRGVLEGDLPLLFDAAYLASFESAAPVAFSHMRLIHQELRRRGVDTRRTFDQSILRTMISARDFEQARAFAAARPHLASRTIPNVVDRLGPKFSGRSVYRYDGAANRLTREALPHPAGVELVMVVDAGCQFSRNALAALKGDQDLRARMRMANLVLITPPRSPIAFHFIKQWNAENPAMPIRAPFNAREWQAVDVAGVPEFHLMKHGKVLGKLNGWPAEGNQEALVKLLDVGQN